MRRFYFFCIFFFGSIIALSGELKRPNIVWLISEDNSVHYNDLYFDTGEYTPEIRKLAEHGVIFNHAFSVSPVCSAARSVLATMCYGSKIGVQYHRKRVYSVLPENMKPVHELLHDAGYYTSFHNKSDYNFRADMGKWSSKDGWHGRAEEQPFFHKHQIAITHESNLQRTNNGGIEAPEFVMPHHPNTPLFRQAKQAYHALHRKMDEEVGIFMRKLAEEGVLEDTFVFYFGDHGGVLPGSKGYLFETGLHVPFVVRIPENFKHLVHYQLVSREDGFIEFTDIGPTALRLGGVKAPNGVDGTAFMGQGVTQEQMNLRDEAIGIADRMDEKYDMVRSLRKGNYKYIRNFEAFNPNALVNIYRYKMASLKEWREYYEKGKLNPLQSKFFQARPAEELYDVVKDPYETVNLAQEPGFKEQLVRMRNRLSERLQAMPDLAFFPESHLIQQGAFSDPVAFGIEHKQEIASLIDIANLALVPFEEAEDSIAKAIHSTNPWKRYWGLITCSLFGKQADSFTEKAKEITNKDSHLLVRMRAAEFLALIGEQNPQEVYIDLLEKSEEEMETLQILNSIVMLQDGPHNYSFDRLDPKKVKTRGYFVDRRLHYLCNIPIS